MKRWLLELLVCPRCGSRPLALDVAPGGSAPAPIEIETGVLRCAACERCFPIVGGIPRLLPDSWDEHRERIAGALRPTGVDGDAREIREFRARQGATRSAFGFEPHRAPATGPAAGLAELRRTTGLGPEELAGKRVLDAGCGAGRILDAAASAGAEVIGLDLSRAVDAAARRAAHPERTQLVQGDILSPPFAPESFDLVVSIAALDHTSDTRSAFRALVPLLVPGGRIAIAVERRFQPEIEVGVHKRAFELVRQLVSGATRLLTTRLPPAVVHALAHVAVPLGWLGARIAARPVLKHLLWPLLLAPVSAHPDRRVRVRATYEWLSSKYQWKHTTPEVRDWFAAAGLERLESAGPAVTVSGSKPMPKRTLHDATNPIERAAG